MKTRVLFIVLMLPLSAHAQQAVKPFEQDTHALRGIIRSPKPIPGYERRFELEPIRDYSQIDPPNTTILVLGNPRGLLDLHRHIGDLGDFVRAGGALLIASDQEIREPLRSDLRVEITGGYILVEPSRGYAGLPDCPLVTDLAAGQPIFRRVSALATNRPSALIVRGDSPLQTFAWLQRPRARFLAGGELGRGRVLVMADHSVFINDMMLQPDTDNFDFAYNCLNWLSESGRRRQVLLIEDGVIVTNFNVSFKPPPLPKLPSQEQIVGRVNELIAEAEEKDQFNQLILNLFGGWRQPRQRAQAIAHQNILRLLLVLASLALAIYGLVRLVGSRYRTDKLVPLLAGAAAGAVPTRPIFELRRQALADSGNCAELARHLARRCLEAGGCTQWSVRPRVAARGSLWQRCRAWWQVRRLWRLATATPRVSPRQLQEITELTATVEAAMANGSLKLNPASRGR